MLLLFFTIIGLDASCQINSTYHYKIVYEMILSYNNPTLYEANFYYNQTKSLFEYEEKSNEDFMDYSVGDSVVHEHLRTNKIFKHKINIDKTENVLTELVEGFIKKELYEIKEPIPIINWNIRDEVKKINKYDCTEATCNFRGRNYSVWFTTDIQTSFGPLKLNGLPGLILEVSDDTKEVVLTTKFIQQQEKSMENKTSVVRQISRLEYKMMISQLMKKVEETTKSIISRMDRNVKASYKITPPKFIEMDYSTY